MPIRPDDFLTGGALQGGVAASLLRARESDAELAPGTRVGAFRVLREIARGGMAIVYLAQRDDGEYEQQVALKWMLQAGPGDSGAELLRRERQALADLRHLHIARLVDGGRTPEGRPWFAMEYIDGAPLDRHCVERDLPRAQRLRLFLQVCSAVAFAHARGVIHRDIKPSNVLVDADGGAKLLDFGIAELLGREHAQAPHAFTPGYASPEQRRGETPTVASDVYQLGCLLAALLSADEAERRAVTVATAAKAASMVAATAPGTVNTAADDASAAASMPASATEAATAAPPVGTPVDAIDREEPALPRALDEDLACIARKATARNPAARYATAAALAADVENHLAQRPVAARERSAGYVAGRFVARHRLGTALAALALLVLVGTVVVFTLRLRAERDAAEYQARVATSVLDFLREDLLAAADPAAAPGRELSVRDALDLASEAADARFAQAPVEHAAIRITLSDLYLQLGRADDAEREARRALELAAAAPEQHVAAQALLADALIARDRLDEAEALQAQVAAANLARHGADSRETLATRNRAARLHNRRGRYDEAERGHAAVAADAARLFGAQDVLALNAASERALNLQMLGRHDEALPIMQTGLEQRRAALGADHPATLEAAHELGVLHRHRGDAQAALAELQPTLEARRRVLGAHHPDTVASTNELATALQDLKRYEEAEPLFRAALDARLATLGESHQYTRNSMSNLGLLYSLWGRLEQAAPLYERALDIELRLIGDGHPDTLALMHNIAGLYRKQGRLDDALATHRRVLDGAQRSAQLGPGAWQTALFRAGFALTLQAAKDYAEGEREMQRAIAALEATLGADHARTVRAREMLAALRAERDGATPAPAAPR